ncbi:hypothetical protein CEV32_0007 [Brucella rhizosphaerae]|uniref:Uncharacterized protein n=1 Tax=Brucella rhizosphaerae TaxID=571254 RepID=A0A256FGM9_9HYPH|nr:hypothetical protein CEV32_0007 [Brucella rhizosphaerae]
MPEMKTLSHERERKNHSTGQNFQPQSAFFSERSDRNTLYKFV